MAVSPDDPIIATDDFPEAMEGEQEQEASEQVNPLKLQELVSSLNIADMLDDDELHRLGDRVKREFDIDDNSRSDWKKRNAEAIKLAMQVAETKNYPFENAANVKYPLVTTSAIQFNARAYPAVVDGARVVKGAVIGYDPNGEKKNKADRIGRHMSWQLTEQMQEWEEDTDKLLLILPIVGTCFRKSYFDNVTGRNCSDLVTADNLVVNYWAKSLSRAPRITQIFELYPYEITERMRAGTFRECDLGLPPDSDGDDDAPHTFLEQHRRWDLDKDGYPEPYIVTIHKETAKVVRITTAFDLEDIQLTQDGRVAKVTPVEYFTKYGFIPSPDGGFYDIGFGSLLGPIGESVNTAINQMLDAGHRQNAGGGFIGKGLRMKAGKIRLNPAEYMFVDAQGQTIRDNIVPLTFNGPSPVLFQLLGLLIEASRDISATKDILTGEQQNANVPASTTLALIEQGLKVFSAIYKRIHRSLKQEFGKLKNLNSRYMPPEEYFRILDTEEQVAIEDYKDESMDVVPVSDPNVVTEAQRAGRAQALLPFAQDPMIDGMEVKKRYFEAIGIENIEALWAKQPPGPPPDLIAKIAETQAKVRKINAEIVNLASNSVLAIAKAEAAEQGPQLQQYQADLSALSQQFEAMLNALGPNAAGMGGVEAQPSDQGLPEVPPGQPGALEGNLGGGELNQPIA